MTELPRLNPVELRCGSEDARLWKRVRTLESSLGYSNLAVEGFTDGQSPHGGRNRQWQANAFDPCTQNRKRRLPNASPSSRAQDSSPQRDLLNSRSIPALSWSPEESSAPPWTQPASQRAAKGHGSLPQLPGSPEETESNRALERSHENSMANTLGAEEIIECRRPVKGSQSPQIGVARFSLERLSKAHRSAGSPVQAQPLTASDYRQGHEASSARAVSSRPCDVRDATEGALGCALVEQAARKLPSNRDILPQTDEAQEPRRFVVRTLPSGKKLRTGRAGSCRSLVSPNNKVFSSTVVARVKLGLQNGDDEKRPKVLIVGSGTFNPIHKVHIRRFHLARNFLQVQKGVSGIESCSVYSHNNVFLRLDLHIVGYLLFPRKQSVMTPCNSVLLKYELLHVA